MNFISHKSFFAFGKISFTSTFCLAHRDEALAISQLEAIVRVRALVPFSWQLLGRQRWGMMVMAVFVCVLQASSLSTWNLESNPVWNQARGFLRNCLQKQEKEEEVRELPSWTDVHVSYLFSWIWMTADNSINLYYCSVNDVLTQLSIL